MIIHKTNEPKSLELVDRLLYERFNPAETLRLFTAGDRVLLEKWEGYPMESGRWKVTDITDNLEGEESPINPEMIGPRELWWTERNCYMDGAGSTFVGVRRMGNSDDGRCWGIVIANDGDVATTTLPNVMVYSAVLADDLVYVAGTERVGKQQDWQDKIFILDKDGNKLREIETRQAKYPDLVRVGKTVYNVSNRIVWCTNDGEISPEFPGIGGSTGSVTWPEVSIFQDGELEGRIWVNSPGILTDKVVSADGTNFFRYDPRTRRMQNMSLYYKFSRPIPSQEFQQGRDCTSIAVQDRYLWATFATADFGFESRPERTLEVEKYKINNGGEQK